MKKRAAIQALVALKPVAVGAAVLMSSALPAQAQYYDFGGSVSTSPTDLIPSIDVFSAALDLRPNSLTVGAGAPGSFSVWAGADLQAAAISLGQNSSGTMVVQGQTEGTPISALVQLTGTSTQAASFTIGSGSGGVGTLNVSAGGKVSVDGRGGPGPNDFVNIGVNGGKGTVEVTGANSAFNILGVNTVLQVGRSGVTQDGLGSSFSVLAGATASALYLNVGRDGAKGTVTIDGVGSKLSQVGVGTNQSPGSNGPAFATLGRAGATGVMTVSGGAEWLISDGGFDGRAAQGSPGFILGIGANSSGSLTIAGAGSKVEIISSTLNPAVGQPDNYNPFVSVGYDNAGTTSGTLTVSGGGRLLLTGNALSTAANPNSTSLNIGGRFDTSGTGTATVTGTDSQIILSGHDSNIQVGRNAGSQGIFQRARRRNRVVGLPDRGARSGPGHRGHRRQWIEADAVGRRDLFQRRRRSGQGPDRLGRQWHHHRFGRRCWQITDGYDTSATPSRGPGL